MNSAQTVNFGLSSAALEGVGTRPFGIYIHVPFCATRCGYCDFNTYTAGELGSSASPQSWLEAMARELELAADLLAQSPGGIPRANTVFIGGGTPSLLGGLMLGRVLDLVRNTFGLAPDAEITTESNPESTSPEFFGDLLAAGFTRLSLGMQSAVPHVLATLDRVHTPGRAQTSVAEARRAGFEHVNLDLIYGTPGERDEDLDTSLEAVVSAGVDHVSAYALIVEDGTALSRRIRRGELSMPDDDVLADRYVRVDNALSKAGFTWYEVSNWAKTDSGRCRHNLGYWDGGDWWGAGPGAHSHIGGVRWWNLKHPARYADVLAQATLPVGGVETLTAVEQHTERVMLTTRLATGIPVGALAESERAAAASAVTDGLLSATGDRFVLTDRGRLLADGVIRSILA
ncbi:radical SAM family heme chaperone HemW [Antrihabitans sp. YC2-6]|uniref:radical SAM family heme chaperone HemW n=1 Tax=Antrihabitans sp. YC2-6 TaxID=2799498 RepID=UPI0018F645FC|nr:radical SAM family heme chaperone HemW [Antrihabitans sp. YC2-6]MBJ8346856.1 coproporphyrinogen III oxidase [Antrihabitans sp. YC2-6]